MGSGPSGLGLTAASCTQGVSSSVSFVLTILPSFLVEDDLQNFSPSHFRSL